MSGLSRFAMAGLAAVTVAGALAVTATPAAADVACNRWGECWRVAPGMRFSPSLGITIRPDAWWRSHPRGNWRWRRTFRGNGYWYRGRWRTF